MHGVERRWSGRVAFPSSLKTPAAMSIFQVGISKVRVEGGDLKIFDYLQVEKVNSQFLGDSALYRKKICIHP